MGMELYQPFLKEARETIQSMADLKLDVIGAISTENEEIVSLGVTSIITYAGKMKGRSMLDMEPVLALALAQNITGSCYTAVKDPMVLATVSELNNIISGGAISALNNTYGLNLWLAPPIVFAGSNCIICIPKIASASINCTTLYGKLRINIAFEGGNY
jgi:chemotaxis protein CheX